ncbi:hypothetical protein RI367_008827 [Sorochytrium milnesiophthora]
MSQSAEPSEQQQARGCGVFYWIFGFLITTVLLCLKIDYNASFSYLAAISANLAISAISAVTSCSLLGFCNCATYVLICLAADGRNEGVKRGWRTLDLPRILQGVASIGKNLCLILAIVSLPLSSLSMVIFKLDRLAAGMRLTYCMIPLWSAIGVVPAIRLLGGTMAVATYTVRISQPRLGRSDNNNGGSVTETEQQQLPPPYTASAELVPPPPAAHRAEGDNLA